MASMIRKNCIHLSLKGAQDGCNDNQLLYNVRYIKSHLKWQIAEVASKDHALRIYLCVLQRMQHLA